jgi:hypothetical protein
VVNNTDTEIVYNIAFVGDVFEPPGLPLSPVPEAAPAPAASPIPAPAPAPAAKPSPPAQSGMDGKTLTTAIPIAPDQVVSGLLDKDIVWYRFDGVKGRSRQRHDAIRTGPVQEAFEPPLISFRACLFRRPPGADAVTTHLPGTAAPEWARTPA